MTCDHAPVSLSLSRAVLPYRAVLQVRGVPALVLFSIVFRIPFIATSVVLTLHVVTGLGRGYGAAGLVATALTVATAIGQPLRGRAMDRVGLRRALLPAVGAGAVLYAVAPFVEYWWLLGLVFTFGLLPVPIFAVTRQSLAAMVPAEQRRTAFALDSMSVELSFMAGPALGVLAATRLSTTTALLLVGACVVLAGLALVAYNPPTAPAAAGESRRPGRLPWSRSLALMVASAMAATVVLAGTDVAIVAFTQADQALSLTAVVFVTWGVGSIIGALVYGAMPRPIPVLWLLFLLGLLTIPIGLAPSTGWLALAILPAAAACAPVITATANAIAGLVPDQMLGEAMGWHGGALTAGTALGAPLAGVAMDAYGPWAGFAVVGVAGVVLALVGFTAVRVHHGRVAVPTG